MANSMKGVTKIVGMAKSVARQTTRALPVLLPAITVVANVADIAASSPDLASGTNEFVKRYSFIDVQAGRIDTSSGMKGAGSLIISGLTGLLVSALT